MVLGGIENIKRPAIIGLFPTNCPINTKCVVLDLGANTTCDEIALTQFAVMGAQFARIVLNKENPTVSVLNVGAENNKGREVEQKTYKLLSEMMPENFKGCIEANEVMYGKSDVIVTDGFTGNITLKSIEGTVKFISSVIKEGFNSSIFSKIGYLFASVSISKATKKIDPRMHNGAMLVGLNGVVVKSHGSTDAIGFANAIKVSLNLLENKINDKIILELKSNESSTANALNSNNSTS
jgi:glycerol-3-phosphate acyltransferase PlsX